MEKNLKYSELLSVYKALLTDKQAEIMEYYYDDDLSLGEIAENFGISRQGVRDFIKRGEESLEGFESKLHFAKKLAIADEIEKQAQEIIKINSGKVFNKRIHELADYIISEVHSLQNEEELQTDIESET